MGQINKERLEETFELHCSRCLQTAITEYLRRADTEQLDDLREAVQQEMRIKNVDTWLAEDKAILEAKEAS